MRRFTLGQIFFKIWTGVMVLQYALVCLSLLGYGGVLLTGSQPHAAMIDIVNLGRGKTNSASIDFRKRDILMVEENGTITSSTTTPYSPSIVYINDDDDDDDNNGNNNSGADLDLVCLDEENVTCNDRDRLLTTFLLAILVGGLGIGRCYSGYVCCGIVKGFTCGGCGIWWLIDWIVLLTHDWCRSENGCSFINW